MSHAQRHPLCDDEQTFLEDTGVALRDAFLSFEVEPVASASLAQVYGARLLDGRQVAVKIQQRPVARFLSVDLWTIENYYALLSYLLPGLRLAWLAEETRRHMTEELDFVAERGNAAQVGSFLPPATRSPNARGASRILAHTGGRLARARVPALPAAHPRDAPAAVWAARADHGLG